ncbi:MAG TPA: PilZN3 domain-containing protein [Spirochaetia bacterium]|nr:PilZN3 domain-containing protein [Spirochaetia bacterium]
MSKTRVQDYIEKYAEQPIRFTPYALKKTGLVQSQVFLKIEDYLLICAPFQLSMKGGIFLVVLSAQEITFFQQFQKKLCSINLTFQQTGSKKPLTLLLRGALDRIGPVKGKQNVCMMDASFKGCPNDLVEIIGDYISSYEGLKSQYDNFSGKAIALDQSTAALMRYNNYVELVFGATRTRATLVTIAANSVSVRLHTRPPGLDEGTACSARLYFQVYQFTANGRVASIETDQAGEAVFTISLEFTPELIEIVDDYFFRKSIQGRGKAAQPSA